MASLLQRIVGSRNDRIVKKHFKVVKDISALEPTIEALSDDELRAKTGVFRERANTVSYTHLTLPTIYSV